MLSVDGTPFALLSKVNRFFHPSLGKPFTAKLQQAAVRVLPYGNATYDRSLRNSAPTELQLLSVGCQFGLELFQVRQQPRSLAHMSDRNAHSCVAQALL